METVTDEVGSVRDNGATNNDVITTTPKLSLNYFSTVRRQMETVTDEVASVRDNGATNNDVITTTPQ